MWVSFFIGEFFYIFIFIQKNNEKNIFSFKCRLCGDGRWRSREEARRARKRRPIAGKFFTDVPFFSGEKN